MKTFQSYYFKRLSKTNQSTVKFYKSSALCANRTKPKKEEFQKILKNKVDIDVDFGISYFSNLENFKHNLNNDKIFQINLKDPIQVDGLIKKYDLIFSIHCKQLFPSRLVNSVRCINIHPGYNPINRGWYPQVFAIIHDLPIGATIHEMDEKLDNGPIIARKLVPKYNIDSSEDLYNRIIEAELDLLNKNIIAIINNEYTPFEPEDQGQVFLKKDFNILCEFDLEEKASFREFLNRLRALNHGDYQNAFYWDPQLKEKVYINLELSKKLEFEFINN